MDLKLLKKINFKALTASLLFVALAFLGTAFIFNLASPPAAYGATASAWNIQRMTSQADDLKFFFDLNGAPALVLNKNGDARASRIFDLDDQNYLLNPNETSNLTALNVAGFLRTSGSASPPTTGTGIEMFTQANIGSIQSYTRTSSAYIPLKINGSSLQLNAESGGNVGIGTTAPGYKMEIAGLTYNNSFGVVSSDLVGPGLSIHNTGASGRKWNIISGGASAGVGAGALGIFDETAGAYRMAINTNGNVGIGTNAPSTRLSLGQTAADTRLLSIYQDGAGTTGIGTYGVAGLALYSYSTAYEVAIGQNAGGTFTPNMVAKGNGNVGIGNVNPQALLEVGNAGVANSRGRIRTSTRDGGGGSRSWDFGASVTDFGNYGFNIRDTGMGANAVFIDYGTGNTTIIGKVGVGGLSSTGCDYSGWGHGLCVGSNLRVQNHARIDQGLGINGFAPFGCPGGHALCVGGSSGGQSIWNNVSDIRFKENIEPISNPLEKVLALEGVYFNFKEVKDYPEFPQGKQMGFIAQQIEPYVPEIVTTGTDGYKSTGLASLTALLTEAIKEQQKQIEHEKERSNNLSKDLESLKAELQLLKQQIQHINENP